MSVWIEVIDWKPGVNRWVYVSIVAMRSFGIRGQQSVFDPRET